MTAEDVPHITRHWLAEHGLAALGWTFAWDKAKLRAGGCHYRTKVISLSRHYVALNVADRLDDVIDTVLHEIAHALTYLQYGPGGYGHGPEWQAICVRIGAKPERCYDSSVVAMPTGRWLACCPACGNEYRRHKRLALKHGRYSYCPPCGPVRGKLEFRDTAAVVTVPVAQLMIETVAPQPKKLR